MKRFGKSLVSLILVILSLFAMISAFSCKRPGGGNPVGTVKNHTVTITQAKDQTTDGKIEAKVNNVAIGVQVAEGSIVTLTYTAGSKNTFKSWKVVKKGTNVQVALKPDSSTQPATFTMPAYDVEISAEVQDKAAVPKHIVILEELHDKTAYGKIEAKVNNTTITSNSEVAEGDTVTLTYTPGTKAKFDEWIVVKRYTNEEVPLNPNKKVATVSFKMPKYEISINVDLDWIKEGAKHKVEVKQPKNQNTDGKIEAEMQKIGRDGQYKKISDRVSAGRTIRLTYKNGNNKKLLKWVVVKEGTTNKLDGTDNGTSPLTFIMPDFPITISAELQEIKKYKVTIIDPKPEEGKITVTVGGNTIKTGADIQEGQTVNIQYTQGTNEKKRLGNWKVVKKGTQDKVTLLYGGNEKNEFTMPPYEVEISAEILTLP